MQKSRINRFRTAFAILFLAFTLYSIFFITHEAHHECSGEDCPICFMMQMAEQNLKLLRYVLFSASVSYLFFRALNNNLSIFCESVLNPTTLISQKIRLND